MPNLSPAQLAEGARLLEAKNTQGMSYDAFMSAANKLNAWLYNHADALLAAAQRVAEVEGCVREIVQAFDANAKKLREMNPGGLGAILTLSMTAQAEASLLVVRNLAASHNIDPS